MTEEDYWNDLKRKRMWVAFLGGFTKFGETLAAVCFVGGILTLDANSGNGVDFTGGAGVCGFVLGVILFCVCGYKKQAFVRSIKELDEMVDKGVSK
ncbi:hypothetical protein TW86_03600 [Halomonas sp. S2151]|uniref:hypothetical protein n=1 Tax=Halomonas sp. S2151 TaxID=579478 RepID=UPI0005FA02CA|nr:hypothetical protein [Halomonas sp. S2151]KJZ17356.1 hypothetical protein TW86_03600 [Halomonas sp. S2151]